VRSEIEEAVVYERAALSRVYFTDRDLGKQFGAILSPAVCTVEGHADYFVHDAPE